MKFDLSNLNNKIVTIVVMVIMLSLLIGIDALISKNNADEMLLDDKDIKVNALVINEIMTSNDGAINDIDGASYDWLELYNGTGKDINLKNYGLSDNDDRTAEWIFPEVVLKSHEYLVIYLTGEKKEGLYANFSLKKKGGEVISLLKSNGKVVDAVKTKQIKKNNSMARNFSGTWIETSEITPGYSNNDIGRSNYIESLVSTEKTLSITEVLPNNKGNFIVDGKLESYIELTNISNETINLSEYSISSDINRPFHYRLPNVKLDKGEVYLVYTNGLGNKNNASFTLSKKSGVVILTHKDKIIEQVTYDDIPNGIAYIKVNNKFYEGNNISPGYPNTTNGKKDFATNKEKNPKGLIINEVMSSNHKYMAQNGGKYYDWIELYNNSDSKINLSDYSLTTDENNKSMYELPDKTLKGHEYIIIMASGDKGLSNKTYPHTNFKISALESLYLYNNDKLIDATLIYNIPNGYSYGRGVNGGHYYFKTPSPKNKNESSGSVLEIAYAPEFSIKAGVYDKKVTLALVGNGTIYYTLDGSEPTKNSRVYNSPIVLKNTSVVRAINYEKGKKASEVVTNSYIIGEGHTLPVVSLSLDSSSFNWINNNINNNTAKNAHVELFDGDRGFSINCGMKIFGGESRSLPKKSYALKFSTKYKGSKLKYKVFDNRDAIEYENLVLRSGSQDMDGTLFRDELVASIIDDYGSVDVQASKPVVLYINGKYWGIYYIRERINEEFISHHYNINRGVTNIYRIDYDVTSGSASAYRDLVNYVRSHDMKDDKNYEYVTKRLDIDNYIDFWVAQIYSGDYDVRNVRYFNNKYIEGNKIRMIGYDFDFSFHPYPDNYFTWMTDSSGMGYFSIDNSLLRGLFNNAKFEKRFKERLSYNLKYVWTKDNINKNYNYFYNQIKGEVKRDHERWGFSYDGWLKETKTVKTFLNNRRDTVLRTAKGFFGMSDKEMKKYFG